MRALLLVSSLLSLLLASGCATAENFALISVGHVGCYPSEIEVARWEQHGFSWIWDASCHGVKYVCSARGNDVACTPRH